MNPELRTTDEDEVITDAGIGAYVDEAGDDVAEEASVG